MGRGVFAEAVPDEGGGLDAPGHPLAGQRDGGEEDRRQRRGGVAQRLLVRVRGEQWLQVHTVALAQTDQAVAHGLVEHLEPLVQPGRHPDVLRPATGEHERHPRRFVWGNLRRHAVAVVGAQRGDGSLDVRRRHHSPVGERPACRCQRAGGVRQVDVGVPLQEIGEPGRRCVEHAGLPSGQDEHLLTLRRWRRVLGRRLLDDDVGVRPADAERTDPDPPRTVTRPWRRLGRQDEGRPFEIEQRTGRRVVGEGWKRAMAQRLDGLDQAGDAGRGVEVADVGLRRHEAAEAGVGGRGAERLGQGGHLDGITDGRAGAMGLEQPDVPPGEAGDGQGLLDDVGVAIDARRQVADLALAVVVDRRALDDGKDRVTVALRIGEPAQGHDAHAARQHGARRALVERAAVAVGREHLAFLVLVADTMGNLDRRSAGEREVALEGEQALDGQVHGDQRRRTGRLHVDRWPAQVELVGQRRREEVLVVGGVAQQEHAELTHELLVGQQVVQHVRVHAAPGEHSDGALEPLGYVSRGLQRLPRALDEVAVLRIHDRRITGPDPEEPGVEHLEVVEHAVAADVVRIGQRGRRHAAFQQPLLVERHQAVLSGEHPFPQPVDVGGTRELAGHADDCDVRLGDLGVGDHVSVVGHQPSPP